MQGFHMSGCCHHFCIICFRSSTITLLLASITTAGEAKYVIKTIMSQPPRPQLHSQQIRGSTVKHQPVLINILNSN